MKKVLTNNELQALADSINYDLGSSLEEMYRSEGMIIDDPFAYPAEPYGTLASLQERLNADAEFGLQHLI